MKNAILIAFAFLSLTFSKAQDLNDLFAAGLDDAELFTNSYMAPLTEATIYSLSNGWYNSADAKPLGGFEISFIGNVTGFKNATEKQSFELNTADYQNLQFVDGSSSRNVASALGDLEGVRVFVEDESGLLRTEFELPTGLLSEGLNFIPTGYVQASVGLIKGLEVKARFLPQLEYEDAKASLLGAGLQYELTKLLPADKLWPIAISAVVGYTNLDGEFDFTDTSIIDGENQRIDASFNTWNVSAVVSTRKIPVINFYGGLGYISGTADINVLGTYRVTSGPFTSETYVDPFTISNKVSGVTANLGTKIKLGFFRLHAEYNIAAFNTATVGINFGFR